MLKHILFFIICLPLLLSCTGDDGIRIDKGLRPYYDTFLDEADKRGVTFTEEQLAISLVFTNINSQGTIGRCSRYFNDDTEVVEIDRFFWAEFDEPTREFVVFHELGHCLLLRGHRDDIDNNGNCRSLMHSYLGLCNFDFTGASRALYIDELFL